MKGIAMMIGALFGTRPEPLQCDLPVPDISRTIDESVDAFRRSTDISSFAAQQSRKTMAPINDLLQRIHRGDAGDS